MIFWVWKNIEIKSKINTTERVISTRNQDDSCFAVFLFIKRKRTFSMLLNNIKQSKEIQSSKSTIAIAIWIEFFCETLETFNGPKNVRKYLMTWIICSWMFMNKEYLCLVQIKEDKIKVFFHHVFSSDDSGELSLKSRLWSTLSEDRWGASWIFSSPPLLREILSSC